MRSNSSGTTSSSLPPRLGPAWRSGNQGGRGFQPPPAVPSDRNDGESITTETKRSSTNRNSFSLLGDADDDGSGPRSSSATSAGKSMEDGGNKITRQRAPFSSRSEGLRSSGGGSYPGRQMSMGSGLKMGSGRSLAELASRVPASRSHSMGQRTNAYDDAGGSNSRMSSLRGELADEKKVIRYTREKLLSMRSKPNSCPHSLKHMKGSPLLAQEALDPVCWDTFDADAIWAQVSAASRERRGSAHAHAGGGKSASSSNMRPLMEGRRSDTGRNDSGKWRRGVALPPAEARGSGGRGRYEDAENPEDLWDDPVGNQATAAADFSAFGGSLDENPIRSRSCSIGSDGFELGSMSEAARKFEEDLHGSTNSADAEEVPSVHVVDPMRPLADAGTTIRSGSGENVNVFEDFGAPEEGLAIKSGDEQTASSRLMQMIGVSTEPAEKESVIKTVDEWGKKTTSTSDTDTGDKAEPNGKEVVPPAAAPPSIFSGFASAVPRNPWGEPALSTASTENDSSALNLVARLKAASGEQNADKSEHERLQTEEILRRQDEEKRRSVILAQQQQQQQQAEAQARQQPQQQNQNHNQLELILIERISTVLENAWGRSNLINVLQALHNEDSRVTQLLGSVDALRALISRHPRRIALAKDPSFIGAEIAVLVMTNAQWQQQQATEVRMQQQQEEQQKMIAAQQEAAARAKAEAESRVRQSEAKPIVITNDPWYYADPQGNVQGPFGGEEMRQWLEAGYFKGDLPISQNPKGSFQPLSSLFPDLTIAFKAAVPPEEEMARVAAKEELEAKAKLEVEKEVKALKAKVVGETKEIEESEVEAHNSEKEMLANDDSVQTGNSSEVKSVHQNVNKSGQKVVAKSKKQSDQLKMLLGLGGGAGNANGASMSQKGTTTVRPKSPKVKEVKKVKSVPETVDTQPQSNATKTKSLTNASSAVLAPQEEKTVTPPVPSSAWGGVGTAKIAVIKKSMSEIQKEEAKRSEVLAKKRGSSQSKSGGWANIAASGGTGAWSGTTVIPSPSPVSSSTPAPSSNGAAGYQPMRSKPQLSTNVIQQQGISRSSTQQIMEEFGSDGKMSPMMETWCKEQMRKLNGSEDLTLVAYCMTLADPIEIKQYITAYLGSTPQVNSFASEFINRKNGNPRQEEWETTAKKGRKKKGGVSSK